MTYDVMTLGETMLRLSPPDQLRIEQAISFESHIGGSESNVAVGLARLGLRVAWLSRLTDNALGHSIVNGIRAHGVDTSHVVWTDQDRVGLYFYEPGQAPRSSQVIYDRAGSAMSNMKPEELPVELIIDNGAKLLHLSGITLAIGEHASATAHQLATIAKQQGWLLSFDVNYRQLLWSTEQAREGCHELATMADILFLPLRDAVKLYGAPDEPEQALAHMKALYPQATIVMTLSAQGAIVLHSDTVAKQATFLTQPVGRLGGGDAFVAGFLYGYLNKLPLAKNLKWAVACAAYKYTIPGDLPLLDLDNIKKLVETNFTQEIIR